MPLYKKNNYDQASALSRCIFARQTDFSLTRSQVGHANAMAQLSALEELMSGDAYDPASAVDAQAPTLAVADGGNEPAYRRLLGAVKDAARGCWYWIRGGGAPQ